MRLLLRWILNACALLGIAYILPDITLTGFYAALITALLLGLVNAVIRPILLVLTLPLNLVTLGLFTFVINALLFWFIGTVVQGFTVNGFVAAFLGALCMTIVSWIISIALKKKT